MAVKKKQKRLPIRILELLACLVMLALICVFFSGHGVFVYEGF